jgi:pyruvate/2-oxoglutarate dehydrogenase complex dihydrolipoamide dehydrogenase (E3) component
LSEAPYLTHETIFENEHLPRHLIVVGAGPVGTELAQAYRRLGSDVSMLAAEFLPGADLDVRDFAQARLEEEGVRILLGSVDVVEMDGSEYVVRCTQGVVRGDMLLVATGRRPNMEELGLEVAGVDHSAQGITVDQYLRTNVGHIYAAGDVLGGAQLTHLAGWQCFQAVRNALLPGRSPGIPRVVPRVIFLDPEVASVGLSEDEAKEHHGEDVLVHRWRMSDLDRALADAEPDGFIKVIARANGSILGASIVAARAGEMISEFVLAMDRGFGLSELSTSLHAYPTWTSAVQQVASVEATDRFLASTLGRLALRLSGLRAHAHRAQE